MGIYGIFGAHYYDKCALILRAHNQQESKELFRIIERKKHCLYFLGYVEYEFFRYLEDASFTSMRPYCVFYGFCKKKRLHLSKHHITQGIDLRKTQGLDKSRYMRDVASIKRALASGRSYEVNLTQELRYHTQLDALSLFAHLSSRQITPYQALLPINASMDSSLDSACILSFSPELFFSIHRQSLITKPMKGTMKRGKGQKKRLKYDEKNRSENVMIVDLLRNDVAKISKKHSLRTKLFHIHTYPTLLQMTSMISARLRKDIRLYDVFHALFPCGSITGAPKKETMALIHELEGRERGVYCGSIGLVHKHKSIFNVAIRTIQKHGNICRYGVGSGIVWESEPKEEYDELELKSAILQPECEYVFETMRVRGNAIVLLDYHYERMLASARAYGCVIKPLWELRALYQELAFKQKDFFAINEELFTHQYDEILRVKLYKNGRMIWRQMPITPMSSNVLVLSDKVLWSKNIYLAYKTSMRPWYQQAQKMWKHGVCYDVAFCNERGELCEGSRSNIVLEYEDRFYTPPLTSGVLPGVYRRLLLERGIISERVLYREDLERASRVYCINSVRGAVEVVLQKHNNKYTK